MLDLTGPNAHKQAKDKAFRIQETVLWIRIRMFLGLPDLDSSTTVFCNFIFTFYL
jgi:hypothetical protein